MKSDTTLQSIVERLSARQYPFESLRERGTDVLVARAALPDGRSAIFKYWNRPGPRGAIRRFTRTGTAYRERAALVHLRRNHLSVPEVYGLFHLRGAEARHTECLVEEDLGVCLDPTEALKEHIRNGDEEAVKRFESEIVRSTGILVRSNLLDTDHRLPNYVVTPNGHPIRLDFELARRVLAWRLHPQQYGLMLGTLLGSYIFSVQPDQARMERFAVAVLAELKPPKRVLRVAKARIQGMLERQKKEIGMDTVFNAPWERGGKS